jgi:hypothetical protein
MAPDPTFAFVGGPWCPTLDFVIAFWIMIYVSHIVNFTILYLNFDIAFNNFNLGYKYLLNQMCYGFDT